jgi:hypothetical protein
VVGDLGLTGYVIAVAYGGAIAACFISFRAAGILLALGLVVEVVTVARQSSLWRTLGVRGWLKLLLPAVGVAALVADWGRGDGILVLMIVFIRVDAWFKTPRPVRNQHEG